MISLDNDGDVKYDVPRPAFVESPQERLFRFFKLFSPELHEALAEKLYRRVNPPQGVFHDFNHLTQDHVPFEAVSFWTEPVRVRNIVTEFQPVRTPVVRISTPDYDIDWSAFGYLPVDLFTSRHPPLPEGIPEIRNRTGRRKSSAWSQFLDDATGERDGEGN